MTAPFNLKIKRAALQEMVEQAKFYRRQSNDELAQRWNKTVRSTIESLLPMPERGAPSKLSTRALPAMRRIPVPGFDSFGVFYTVDTPMHLVTVVAVLHASRDIEQILSLPRE